MPKANPASSRKGMKLKTIPLSEKVKILDRMDAGGTLHVVCEEFGIKRSTFYDIKKARNKIRNFALTMESQGVSGHKGIKRIRALKYDDLDQAVFKWYKQQRSVGVAVRGIDLQHAGARLATHLGIQDFKASPGWLFRFRSRHCITNRKIVGESLSADLTQVDAFRNKLTKLMRDSGLLLSQVYNADETGLYWRAPPSNTQAHRMDSSTPGRKIRTDRFSALMCANADGSHRLKLCVVGKFAKPRCLKNIMDSLPVHYMSNPQYTAWFNSDLFQQWFDEHAVPEIVKDQIERQKVARENVKAIIIIDNAPAHPSCDELCSTDGKIRCIFLPPNTTSILQPMDQGIIECCKRFYRTKLMNECFVVLETEEDIEVEDTRGKRTLENLKNYSIRHALFNIAEAWSEVSPATLANGWNKLLRDTDVAVDFAGFQPEDFLAGMKRGGAKDIGEEDIVDWLEMDQQDPGYHHETEEEIAASVASTAEHDSDEESEGETTEKIKLAQVRKGLEDTLLWLEQSGDKEVQKWFHHIREFRSHIIQLQHSKHKQFKIHDFFKPMPRSSSSRQHLPSTSSEGVASSSDTGVLAIATSTESE